MPSAWKKPKAKDEPPIQPVQGIMPDSVQEWRVAVALNRLKLDYSFQYAIDGGRTRRGGQVIDFLVYTVPFPTPVFVQGVYWHDRKTENEDHLKQLRAQRLFNGQIAPNVLLKDTELTTMSEAYAVVKRELNL